MSPHVGLVYPIVLWKVESLVWVVQIDMEIIQLSDATSANPASSQTNERLLTKESKGCICDNSKAMQDSFNFVGLLTCLYYCSLAISVFLSNLLLTKGSRGCICDNPKLVQDSFNFTCIAAC